MYVLLHVDFTKFSINEYKNVHCFKSKDDNFLSNQPILLQFHECFTNYLSFHSSCIEWVNWFHEIFTLHKKNLLLEFHVIFWNVTKWHYRLDFTKFLRKDKDFLSFIQFHKTGDRICTILFLLICLFFLFWY